MNRLAALGTTLVLALNGSPMPIPPHPGTRVSWVVVWGWVVLAIIAALFGLAILMGIDSSRRTPRRPT